MAGLAPSDIVRHDKETFRLNDAHPGLSGKLRIELLPLNSRKLHICKRCFSHQRLMLSAHILQYGDTTIDVINLYSVVIIFVGFYRKHLQRYLSLLYISCFCLCSCL
ncbi:hypothetical protein B0O99DRAFT_167417 [Bisporella sp. PMI_857]|nr:hypothetical protein B0O99DRAFT_167417 [Bisporella sp. PMI_857]